MNINDLLSFQAKWTNSQMLLPCPCTNPSWKAPLKTTEHVFAAQFSQWSTHIYRQHAMYQAYATNPVNIPYLSWVLLQALVCTCVLVWAGTGLISFIAFHMMLCLEFVTKRVLVIQGYFCYCWHDLQCQGFFCFPPHQWGAWEYARSLERTQLEQLILDDQRDIPDHMMFGSDIKAEGKEGKKEYLELWHSSLQVTLSIMEPGFPGHGWTLAWL